MGTRSLTVMLEEGHKGKDGKEIIVMYRQMDGYPTGHGQELVDFLTGIKLVNGICPGDKERQIVQANGMGCLAAQLVSHFKTEVGNFYLYPSKTRDCGEEWIYTVYPKDGRVCLRVQSGSVTFFGLPGTKQKNMPVVFDGELTEWDAKEVEDTASKLADSVPNDWVQGRQRKEAAKAIKKA